MKKLFYIGFLVSLCSCGPRMYSYKFSLKESEKPGKLYYETDTLSIKFKFYLEGLMIGLANKTGETIKVKWDEVRMAENGTDKKIEHVLITEEKNYIYQPPSDLYSKSGCNDLIVYAANIYYLNEDGEKKLKVKEMYPTEGDKHNRDSILNLKGQRITLYFPIEIKNVSHTLIFNFSLDDINSRRRYSALDALLIPLYSF